MGLQRIDIKEAEDYEPYVLGNATATNKWSFSRVKYFSMTPNDEGWDEVLYYYDLKSNFNT